MEPPFFEPTNSPFMARKMLWGKTQLTNMLISTNVEACQVKKQFRSKPRSWFGTVVYASTCSARRAHLAGASMKNCAPSALRMGSFHS